MTQSCMYYNIIMYVCKQIEIMIPPPKLVAIYCNTTEKKIHTCTQHTLGRINILICYNYN